MAGNLNILPSGGRLEGSGVHCAPISTHYLSVVPYCGKEILRSLVFTTKGVGTAQGGQLKFRVISVGLFRVWVVRFRAVRVQGCSEF